MLRTVHFMEASVVDILFVIAMLASSETQGQIKGARESLNGWKSIYGTKKSKERREEPLGTMSYQTSSKRSPPLWLLIGARKTQVFKFPSFTFLRAIFFHPFRLSLAPTICPWVSEDGFHLTTETKFLQFCLFPSSSFSIAADLALFTIIHKEPLFWPYDEQLLEFFHDRVVFWGDHDAWPLPEFHSLAKKVF